MSNDEPTLYEGGSVPQYGQDIKEPGEPFGADTLDTIRTLVAEDDVVPDTIPEAAAATTLRQKLSRKKTVQDLSSEETAQDVRADSDSAHHAPSASSNAEADWHDWANGPSKGSWRKIQVVEGGPGRALRRFLTTPRLLSILFLSGVVYWKPMFIPVLALVLISVPLLIGALIGQDRMARFMMRRFQRLLWNNPDLARALEKVTPRRNRHFLHRPASEDDVWDGPIDPAFAERLSRIRY
ncbi:MAG: hypothetical protein GY764_12885 [Halieaceae bacterium]|nr:hypothetical protein [Halieaceae bacterium]